MKRIHCALQAFALLWLAIASARPALAALGRVVVIRPSGPDAVLSEAVIRIQGELIADGFEVVVSDASAPSASLADPAAPDGTLATIALVVDQGADIVELRVVDQLTNKVVVRRAPLADSKAPRAAQTLAVHAVDLLRASLLELLVAPRSSSPSSAVARETRAQAATWAARPLTREPLRAFSVDAGAGILLGVGGIGPSALATARGRYEFLRPLSLRLSLAGLGTTSRVVRSTGTARVAQDVGTVELLAELRASSGLALITSLGAGALYVNAEGTAEWPYHGRQQSLLAAVFDAGIGLRLRLAPRFELGFETHALLAEPYPVIRFLDSSSAHGDRPGLFQSLTLGAWL